LANFPTPLTRVLSSRRSVASLSLHDNKHDTAIITNNTRPIEIQAINSLSAEYGIQYALRAWWDCEWILSTLSVAGVATLGTARRLLGATAKFVQSYQTDYSKNKEIRVIFSRELGGYGRIASVGGSRLLV